MSRSDWLQLVWVGDGQFLKPDPPDELDAPDEPDELDAPDEPDDPDELDVLDVPDDPEDPDVVELELQAMASPSETVAATTASLRIDIMVPPRSNGSGFARKTMLPQLAFCTSSIRMTRRRPIRLTRRRGA